MANKNVICITIDALAYDSIEREIDGEKIMPFLASLSEKGCTYTNMYSQAPYTEAALVALLGGENVLDNGGYILGNSMVKETIFNDFRNNNYKVILGYSPYIYSKALLRDVDEFFYTRFFSIKPLMDYRLKYFREKRKNENLNEQEYEICMELLKESYVTWIEQLEALINKKEQANLILPLIDDLKKIQNIKNQVWKEYNEFRSQPIQYINRIFDGDKEEILLSINNLYNERKRTISKEALLTHIEKLKIFQKKYTKICKKQKIKRSYWWNCIRNKNNIMECKKLISTYINYYSNNYLSSYFTEANETYKPELGLKNQLDEIYARIQKKDKNNENFLVYIQPQDFHLPSVFHSFDISDTDLLKKEMEEAYNKLTHLNIHYRGNILADLSAAYCDKKIEEFFNKISNTLQNEFIFVVTADHGYPCYDNPPRNQIYNQTYREAFHIPLVIFDSGNYHYETIESFNCNVDFGKILKQHAYDFKSFIPSREYVLCEYAGPGCPFISNNKIWYTYIDDTYRVSFQAYLGETISIQHIQEIYNYKNDKDEMINLIYNKKHNENISHIIKCVDIRHEELSSKFSNYKFETHIIENIKKV